VGSRKGLLGGALVGALGAVAILIAMLGGQVGSRTPSPATPAPASEQAPASTPVRHLRPDVADYNVLLYERTSVRSAARETRGAIVGCRRQVRAAFSTGLRPFNECASLPLRHNIYRAHVEGPLLAIGVQNLKPGLCRAQALGIGEDLSTLGDLSQGWFGLYEQGRADLVGSALVSLRVQTRTTIHELLRVTASVGSDGPTRALARACRPRPYDSADHAPGARLGGAFELRRDGPHA
jgi:hypothetical protein